MYAVSGGALPAAQIARHTGLTRQTVQRTVDLLAAEELVAFEDNPYHQRARLVRLTAKGEALQQLGALAPGASIVVEGGGVGESGRVTEAAETEEMGAVPVPAGRPTVGEERDPFLDASPAALQELERWRREQERREEREQGGQPVSPRPVAA
jgi:hypothetical protein